MFEMSSFSTVLLRGLGFTRLICNLRPHTNLSSPAGDAQTDSPPAQVPLLSWSRWLPVPVGPPQLRWGVVGKCGSRRAVGAEPQPPPQCTPAH